MRGKDILFVLILTIALLFCSAGLAYSPTPMPPLSFIQSSRDSCGNHIHLSVSGLTSEPPKHLLYSHENGVMADGILMFTPLEKYVEWEQIQVISRDQFLSAKLTVDAYVDSLSYRTDFYLKTENGLEPVGGNTSLSELPEGTYLIRMDCSAAHNGVAYRFFYLFWVN